MIPLATRFRAVVHYTHFLHSLRKVSKLYSVSKSSLHRWIQKDPRALAIAKQVSRRRRASAFSNVRHIIKEEVEANPFTTMDGLSRVLKERCGLKLARTTVGRYRAACGFAWKKAFRTVVPKHDPQRVRAFCEAHIGCRENLVCIDEACFYVGDHPKRGYSQRGQRLTIATSRTVRRRKFTLLMAVAQTGIVHYKILDHNCKKPDFVQFIGELNVRPGAVLLMDNVAFHHSKETAAAVQNKGCTQLFIPPYSPDFNAIENIFGVAKQAFRAQCPRHVVDGTEYDAIMRTTLEAMRNADFTTFFERARRFSAQALSA